MQNKNIILEKSLFSLSWPIFVDIFLHIATLFINTYMISQVSISMVAATTVGNQFFDIFIPIFNFISIGCSIVIAQYLGAGNRDLARKAIHISITFNVVIGLLSLLYITFFGYQSLIWMNTPPDILQLSYDYFHILGICLLIEAVGTIVASCLRVFGKSQVPMYVSLVMNMITVIGNIIVLYGLFGLPKMGLIGVAWSTVFGRVIGLILLICFLVYGLRIKLEFKLFFNWSSDLLKKIFKIGLPSAGENLSWSGQCLVMTAFIGLIGEMSLAAHAIYFQLSYFMMLFSLAIGIGNEILVGHMVGAKQFDNAYKRTFKSLWVGMIVTFMVVMAFFLLRKPLLYSFTDNMEVINTLLPIFVLSIFLEPGRTLNITMVNALRATGDAAFPFYTALIFMWGIAIPIGYFLGIKMGMGLLGIWIGFACDEWIRGLVNAWRWKSRRWEAKRLDV